MLKLKALIITFLAIVAAPSMCLAYSSDIAVASKQPCVTIGEATKTIFLSRNDCKTTPTVAFFNICKGQVFSGNVLPVDTILHDSMCATDVVAVVTSTRPAIPVSPVIDKAQIEAKLQSEISGMSYKTIGIIIAILLILIVLLLSRSHRKAKVAAAAKAQAERPRATVYPIRPAADPIVAPAPMPIVSTPENESSDKNDSN